MTKILLVEDDKSLREIYGVRLLAEGYDIVSAGDGEEALAMAIKERPSLVVSDVMMPKISGFDMLDILRSTTETKDIKVIMMTALSSDEQRARGESLGADRYLVKSQVGIEDVVRMVHEVLDDAPVTATQNFNAADYAQPAQPQAPVQPAQQLYNPASAVPAPAPQQPAPQPQAATPQYAPQAAQPQVQAPAAAPQPVFARPAAPASAYTQPVQQPSLNIPTRDQQAPQMPQPFAPQAPVAQPVAAPAQETSIPVPTAPFSSPRPASLGERVIHPLPGSQTAPVDMNELLDRELAQQAGVSLDTIAPVQQPTIPPFDTSTTSEFTSQPPSNGSQPTNQA